MKRKGKRSRKRASVISNESCFYRVGNLSSRTKSIWRDERRLKYHPSRYFRMDRRREKTKGIFFSETYSLIVSKFDGSMSFSFNLNEVFFFNVEK